MKKVTSLVLIILLMCFGTFVITGCGNDNDSAPASDSNETTYDSGYSNEDDTDYDSSDSESYDSSYDSDDSSYDYDSGSSSSDYDDYDTDDNGTADWRDVDTDDDGNVSQEEMDKYLDDWEQELDEDYGDSDTQNYQSGGSVSGSGFNFDNN